MYTDEMKQIIHNASIGDIEIFGFTFDSTATTHIGNQNE